MFTWARTVIHSFLHPLHPHTPFALPLLTHPSFTFPFIATDLSSTYTPSAFFRPHTSSFYAFTQLHPPAPLTPPSPTPRHLLTCPSTHATQKPSLAHPSTLNLHSSTPTTRDDIHTQNSHFPNHQNTQTTRRTALSPGLPAPLGNVTSNISRQARQAKEKKKW